MGDEGVRPSRQQERLHIQLAVVHRYAESISNPPCIILVCVCIQHILVEKDDSLDTAIVGMTHAVVVMMLEGLEGRGHHVYTDNFYSSPALFGDLRRLGFGACGTVRINQRGVPS